MQLGGARKDERRHPAASSIYEPATGLIMSKKLTTEDFISRARKKHGDKYIYDKCEYVNAKTKIVITCKEHGDFMGVRGVQISQDGARERQQPPTLS